MQGFTSPPPKSSGRSAGGGSRSPAGTGDVSTAALFSPCPEDAACPHKTAATDRRVRRMSPRSRRKKKKKGGDSLFPQEVAAQGDHAEQDLQHLLHHVDLPPQLILPLFTVSVHSDVETLVELERMENGQLLE